jgi:heat shock protein HslJ
MKHICWGVLILLILGVACAGCTGQKPAPPQITTISTPVSVVPSPVTQPAIPSKLAGNWVLTTMAVANGTAIQIPTTQITLTFNNDSTIDGNGGCNNYFSSFTLTGITTPKGEGLVFGPVGSTKMYCQATSDQENTYLQLLQDTSAYVVDTTQLTLTGNEQNVLIFQRPSTVPVPGGGELPA